MIFHTPGTPAEVIAKCHAAKESKDMEALEEFCNRGDWQLGGLEVGPNDREPGV